MFLGFFSYFKNDRNGWFRSNNESLTQPLFIGMSKQLEVQL